MTSSDSLCESMILSLCFVSDNEGTCIMNKYITLRRWDGLNAIGLPYFYI